MSVTQLDRFRTNCRLLIGREVRVVIEDPKREGQALHLTGQIRGLYGRGESSAMRLSCQAEPIYLVDIERLEIEGGLRERLCAQMTGLRPADAASAYARGNKA